MEERRNVKKVRLLRDIVLGGEHADKGSVFSVARPLAQRLIGEGSAEDHVEEGEELEAGPVSVNRMEHPTNADPQPQKVRGPAPKVKVKEKEKDEKDK